MLSAWLGVDLLFKSSGWDLYLFISKRSCGVYNLQLLGCQLVPDPNNNYKQYCQSMLSCGRIRCRTGKSVCNGTAMFRPRPKSLE